MKNRGKVFKGFALVEVIVLLLATSVAISSSMVGMSVRKSSEVKVDQNVQNCILVENGNPASAACQAMVNGCKYNQESSCNTLATYANSANATQAQFALTALKDACYNGSKRACDYIVKSCAENSSKCDIASTEGDLKYFLDLNTTVSSAGRFYIEKELQNYYKNGIKNIVNEIDTICPTPCNDAGDNYWKTACGVLRAVKGAGFCQDINEDVPNPSPPPPPPAAPTSLTASLASSTTVQLTWNDVATNEDGYYVYQSIGSVNNWQQIKTLAANSTSTVVDLGSTPVGGTYYYLVRGYNATGGPGSPSNTASVFVVGKPATPVLQNVSFDGTQTVTLTWVDNANNEDGFKVWQKVPSGSFVLNKTIATPNVTTTTIDLGSNPVNGTYSYYLQAYNSVLTSANSNTVDVAVATKPWAPAMSTISQAYTGGNYIVHLCWSDTSHNETGFHVLQKIGAGAETTVATVPANTTCTDINLGATPTFATYYYNVDAYNAQGTTLATGGPLSTVAPMVPTAPSGVSAAVTTPTSVSLTWTDNASNETGFKVYQKIDSGAWALVKTEATPNATTTTVSLGATPPPGTYYYKVRAYNTISGESTDSNISNVSVEGYPGSPSSVTATFDGTQTVTVNWTDNANNETGFKIWQNVNGAGWILNKTVSTADTTSTTIDLGSNPINGTYQYYVESYNTSMTSDPSVTATVSVATAPLAPSGFGISSGMSGTDHIVTLTWGDASHNEQGFKIYQQINSGGYVLIDTLAPNTTTKVINYGVNPTPYGTYAFKVSAYNTVAEVYYPGGVSTGFPAVPHTPTTLTSSYDGVQTITLSWTDNSHNEDGYKVYQKVPSGSFVLNKTIAVPNTTSTTINLGATPAQGTYEYYVQAYNATDTSASSNTSSVLVISAPTAPSGVAGSFNGTQTVTLTWTDTAFNETGFKVWQNINSAGWVLNKTIATPNTTSTTIDIGANPVNGTYQYYVQSYNSGYTSANSNTASVTIIKIPIAPASLTASYNSATTTVTLNWTCAATNETGFKVYQMAPADADFVLNKTIATANTITTTVSLGASPASGTYQYYVRSYNAGWDSANSNTASISVVGAPSDVTASFDGTQTVTVNWTDNAANEDGFKVWQKTPSGSFILNQTIATPDTTSTTIDLGANPANGTYQYYVQAYNVGGTSVNSNTASLAVVSPPAAPSSVAGVQNGAQTINLTWTDNANNETGFKVYQKGPADSDFVLNKTIATANTTSTSIDLGASPTLGTYEYYVQAYNATYTSVNSNTASVVVVAAPPDPVNLWIEDVGGTLRYHWIDPSGDPSLYIYRVRSNPVDTVSGSSSNVIDGPGNERTYDDDSPLTAHYEGDYTITVQQYDFAHNLKSPGVTIIVYVEPISYFVPAAPTGLSGVFDGTQTVTLNWTDNATNEDGFKIWQKTPSGSFVLNKVIATRNVTSAAINLGANPELGTYQYYVQSYNAGSTSANSNTASVAVMYPPTAPSGTAASFDGTQTVTVNWTDNSDNEDGFKVWQKTPTGSFVLNKTVATPDTTSTTIDLTANHENGSFEYYVQSYNAGFTSANSNTATVDVATAPSGAPSGVSGSLAGTIVTLNWTDNAGNEDGFYVWQKTASGSFVLNKTIATPNTVTTTIDLGANPENGTYQYYVQAYNTLGTSADSNTANVSVVTTPAAPSGVTASYDGNQTITVNWTDNSNNELGFKVWQNINSAGWVLNKTIATPNTTSTTIDIGANPVQTSLKYYVQSYNSGYTSANSNTASVAMVSAPLAPSGAGASFNGTQTVTVTWTDNASNETGFYVYQSINNTTSWILVATVAANTTSTVVDLGSTPAGGTYYYKVQAYNSVSGASADSNIPSVAMAGYPQPPSGVSGTFNGTQTVTLNWTDNANNETGFKVWQNINSGGWVLNQTIATANTTSATVNLGSNPPNGTYQYYVQSYNTGLTSANSNTASVAVATVPWIPSGLGVSQSMSGSNFIMNLTWSDTSHNETGFKVYQKIGAGSYALAATLGANVGSTTINLGSSPTAGTYYYKVTSYNAQGESAASNEVNAVVTLAPTAPSGTASSKTYSGSNLYTNVSWADNSNNETGFRVYQNGTLVATLGAGVVSTSVSLGTTPGVGTYTYTVTSYNAAGESTASAGSSITIGNAQTTITSCNGGNVFDCTLAYNYSWNRSCLQIKTNYAAAVDGTYVITPISVTNRFNAYCDMTTDGGGWTLIGKGREGWTWNNAGQSTSTELLNYTTNTVATLPAATINGIINGVYVKNLSDGLRVRRNNGLNQEFRLKITDMNAFTWAFNAGFYYTQSPDYVSYGTYHAQVYKNGTYLYTRPTAETYWQTEYPNWYLNTCDRIFTWSWDGQNYIMGWATGTYCSTANAPGAWYSGNTAEVNAYIVPQTTVWLRQ